MEELYDLILEAKDSIYESFYKLNSENPETEEKVAIGEDICCNDPEGYCRDPDTGNLIFASDKAEEKEYTLKEKLVEVQKLLNRSRDFGTYMLLIEELIEMDLAERQEIDNIPVDARLDLSNCDVLIAQLAEQAEAGGAQNALVNCWLAGPSNYGYLQQQICSLDPPFDCEFFNETFPRKKRPLLCYCFEEVFYPELTDDFFCCKGIE
jgi:hypothetical protein